MIPPEELLAAYAHGYFPMADSRDGQEIRWYYPETRGVIPLEYFHVPRSLRKFLNTAPFAYRCNTAFTDVIRACADARGDTWINDAIIDSYIRLHQLGFAHSVECWKEDQLAGGLYGVALGGAFFGESMFSRTSNASKAALVELVRRLNAAGYTLLDAQYTNEHLTQFGIKEIAREQYLALLADALGKEPLDAFA